MRTMTKWVTILGLIFVAGCDDDDPTPAPELTSTEFWSWTATSPIVISLTLQEDASGQRVAIFITDGFPGGVAESFSGPVTDGTFELSSVSGNAVIEGSVNDAPPILGSVHLPDGSTRNFGLTRARLGAGRYEIEVDDTGLWTGSGPGGNVLTAQTQGDLVSGSIVTGSGETFPFQLHDMSQVLSYGNDGSAPDRYTAFVGPRGYNIFGRGHGAADGAFNANFVNLDLPITTELLPGVFFGRLQFRNDLLLVDINEPAVAGGPRTVKVYASDAEPEPDGDIEWFSGEFTGDSFAFTSASGDAQIAATVDDSGVTGALTYVGQPAVAFFAGPAGEGAGVYDVTVDDSFRVTGTSEEGGSLELIRNGTTIDGTVTTPAGTELEVRIHDMVRLQRFADADNIATVPDSYVAFVAPRARYIVGRSGNVRDGTSNLNIIGLDSPCIAPTE
jgi:hypothetical protein